MKKLLTILLILVSVNAWAETIVISNTNLDGNWLAAGEETNFFINDATTLGMPQDQLMLGVYSGFGMTKMGLHIVFPIVIPAGSTITSAVVKLTKTAGSANIDDLVLKVVGEKTNTPAVISDGYEGYVTRRANATTAVVSMPTGFTIDHMTCSTPDISTVVQEIVNLGETTGVAIFIDDPDSSTPDETWGVLYGYNCAVAVEHTEYAPTLEITYTSGGGSTKKQQIGMMW